MRFDAAPWYNIVTASSYHPGGVNVVLGDGSVRFVSETIDMGTDNSFPNVTTTPVGEVSGDSPFGIWGAMGSRNGGEAKSF
ncbi:MAG: DUF1559 domain-containing protein [Planctomycetaceae bacterium]|nr:DUF1559 domain-containing protein [Planctomycetaceae bacterium]